MPSRANPFRRPHHNAIARILRRIDGDFLLASRCFFGGGTCIALLYGEYRESRDIDFIVSDRAGFRVLRETVGTASLGRIARADITLAREVRADRDGIRTFVVEKDLRIKIELILEGRIDLAGAMNRRLGVPVLAADCLAADMLLANADRGGDDATWSRDLIDLAFLAAGTSPSVVEEGLALAKGAYGGLVLDRLAEFLTRLRSRRGRLAECARVLGISDLRTLERGLTVLRPFTRRKRGSPST
jgi:hypothetical protein